MTRYTQIILVLILALASATSSAKTQLTAEKGPAPDWVEPFAFDFTELPVSISQQGGGYFLIYDLQQNLKTEQTYIRNAYYILNKEGVNNFSDLNIDFEPSFETLTFNTLRIYRDGQVINHLPDIPLDFYRREQALEVGFFDGVATTVVHLPDVREGDVIEWAVTRTGANPMLAGHFSSLFRQKYSYSCMAISHRLITRPGQDLQEHLFNNGQSHEIVTTKYGRELTWSDRNVTSMFIEGNSPPWYDPTPRAELTSFNGWGDVAEWALPLYEISDTERTELAELAHDLLVGKTSEQRILAAIHFVQDNVRYLGQEEGLWGYQPRNPVFCFQQRFGDCKEKSLLLVALLDLLDIEAFPLLVSTKYQRQLGNHPPAPSTLNHCVVGLEFAGETIFVDPTMNHQGGSLDNWYFPDYGAGLPVRPGTANLIKLPRPKPLRTEFFKTYIVDSVEDGGAKFTVISRFFDGSADNNRAFFAAQDHEQLGHHYVRIYASRFPGISQTRPIEIQSDNTSTENTLTVFENYRIQNVWQRSQADSAMSTIRFAPLELQKYFQTTPSPARTAPFFVGGPVNISTQTELKMPKSWPLDFSPVEIIGSGYKFTLELFNQQSLVQANINYQRDIDVIPPDETQTYLADHERMQAFLGLYLYRTWQPGFQPKILAIMLALVSLVGCIILAVRLQWKYDPAPVALDLAREIGGWLILFIILLMAQPLYQIYGLQKNPALFDQATWSTAAQGIGSAAPAVAMTAIALEIVGNVILFVWSLWLIGLFFSRRTSLPRASVAYLIAAVAFSTLFVLIRTFLFGDGIQPEILGEVLGTWILLAIWGPYFLMSPRVKETFLQRSAAVGRGE